MVRKQITGQWLSGERAAFELAEADLAESIFAEGESPLKHSLDIDARQTVFEWKYPFWYAKDVSLTDSAFLDTARSGPWYVDGLTWRRVLVAAPKTLRHSQRIVLDNVQFTKADETLWWCQDVQLDHVTANGDYFGMNSTKIKASDLSLFGNYAFDGCQDIEISGSKLLSKDAFWNCQNVVVRDSIIVGEYLGWNSKNLTFINCLIESLQGLCYIDNLTIKDCRLLNTTLAFEYSTVDVEVKGSIDSIINPTSGIIKADQIGQIVLDPERVDPQATTIITKETQ